MDEQDLKIPTYFPPLPLPRRILSLLSKGGRLQFNYICHLVVDELGCAEMSWEEEDLAWPRSS